MSNTCSHCSVVVDIADGMRGSESLDTSECGKQDNDRLGERHREFVKEAAVRKERERGVKLKKA